MYIDEALFRDIYHKFLYIDCKDALKELEDVVEMIPDATGLLVYCFAEDRLGLSFNILASAEKKEDGTVIVGPQSKEDFARVRFRDVRDYEFELAEQLDIDTKSFENVIEPIHKYFESGNKQVTMLRDLEMLDKGRNLEFPDYISVNAMKKGYLPEVVWVNVTGFGKDVFYGTLLEAPKQGFGYTNGQEVSFRAYENEGEIYLILGENETEA